MELLYQRFQRIVEKIQESKDEEYILDMLGAQIVAQSSFEFSETSACLESGIDYFEHIATRTPRERGWLVAVYRATNMLAVIERHETRMRRKRAKQQNASQNNIFQAAQSKTG